MHSIYKKIKLTYIKDEPKSKKYFTEKSVVSSFQMQKAYKTLNLPYNSSFKEVKKAYREMVKKYHPDVYNKHLKQSKEFAVKMFNEITEAYKMIRKYT